MHYHHIKKSDNHSIHIVQLGIGLIGNCISDKISRLKGEHCEEITKVKIDWFDTDSILNQLKLLERSIDLNYKEDKIHIIWSAGKAGFSSDEKECNQEYLVFKKVIDFFNSSFCKACTQKFMYLFSSAGGLFEGEYVDNKHKTPKPKRPYGFLKLNQENYLIAKVNSFEKVYILRPSSVFSSNIFFKRLGIIGVLVSNGILNQVTKIYGKESTIRDYILAEDIAAFVVDLIENGNKEYDDPIFLISTEPVSIYRLKTIIENIIDKPLLFQYLNFTNSENIFYHPNIKPSSLHTTPLIESIKITKENFLKGQFLS